MTLGSLFDGIGGFPLAGVMCGITPVLASEIEPFPMKVTEARFPEMKQLGSVTDINGAEVEPVDIITFGSPCQDLSVAGKQLGIHEGQRSNLFFEAVRIIKEMRDAEKRTGRADVDIRPRFAVWENVPGAFSSNGGEDFRAVLEAVAGVCEDGLHIPRPKRWNHAGCMVGNGWSIAWRVYDAQYWGVPQRRKRIYLIADFASERAGEILFEREGVCGNPAACGAPWQGTAIDAEGGAGGSRDAWAFKERAGKPGGGKGFLPGRERAFTLSTGVKQSVCYAVKGNFIDRDTKQNGCVRTAEVICSKGDPPRKYIVRRLTPTECARLQGFPDWWCEGLGGSDSAIYKAYGNGLALPCAYDVLRRIANEQELQRGHAGAQAGL